MAAKDLLPKLGVAFMSFTTAAYGMRNSDHPFVFGGLAGAAAYASMNAAAGSDYGKWAAAGAIAPIALLGVGILGQAMISSGAMQGLPARPYGAALPAYGYPRIRRR